MNELLAGILAAMTDAYEWSFLIKRVVLTEDTAASTAFAAKSVWSYAYDVPDDIGFISSIEVGGNRLRPEELEQYGYEYDIDGSDRKLVTNVDATEIIYSQQITSLNTAPGNTRPPAFAWAVAYALAREAAMPLNVNPALADRLVRRAQEVLEEALTVDQMSRHQRFAAPDSEFISGRG